MRTSPIFIAAALMALLLPFQNCSENLPVQDISGKSSSASTLASTPSPTPTTPASLPAPGPAPASFSTVRVLSGRSSPFTDSRGQVWQPDVGFSGGIRDPAPNPTYPVVGTPDIELYDHERYGEVNSVPASFSYSFSVSAGTYMVRLLFCENFFNAVGDRVMDVSINGQLVLDNFDILGNSGGVKFKPVDRLIPVTMNSAGNIRITFDPALNNAPNVASLEITKL